MALNAEASSAPPTLWQLTVTISSAPAGPKALIWHQCGTGLIAVTCATPPAAAWPTKSILYSPGPSTATVLPAGVGPELVTAPFHTTKPYLTGTPPPSAPA